MYPWARTRCPWLEQCKEIVHKFNTVYGETLTDPQIVLPSNKACLRLHGIDGKAKMSKSLGNCIYLSDEADVVKKKTCPCHRPNHLRVRGSRKSGRQPVFIYLEAFSRPEHSRSSCRITRTWKNWKTTTGRGGLGDVKVKKFLNNVMQAELTPIRERRKEWEAKIPDVYDILKAGSAVAEKKAAETMTAVKKAMQIDYFG